MRIFTAIGLCLLLASPAKATPPSLYDRIAAKLAHDPKLANAIGKPTPELRAMRWMLGTWNITARVFATPHQKEGVSKGRSVIAEAFGGTWFSQSDTYGGAPQDQTWLTYNPVTHDWVSVSIDSTGNAVTTRAKAWRRDKLVFSGIVLILGEKTVLRQTLEKRGADAFAFRNEEQLSNGNWVALDEYVFQREPAARRTH